MVLPIFQRMSEKRKGYLCIIMTTLRVRAENTVKRGKKDGPIVEMS